VCASCGSGATLSNGQCNYVGVQNIDGCYIDSNCQDACGASQACTDESGFFDACSGKGNRDENKYQCTDRRYSSPSCNGDCTESASCVYSYSSLSYYCHEPTCASGQ
jgi:hypothetical protein